MGTASPPSILDYRNIPTDNGILISRRMQLQCEEENQKTLEEINSIWQKQSFKPALSLPLHSRVKLFQISERTIIPLYFQRIENINESTSKIEDWIYEGQLFYVKGEDENYYPLAHGWGKGYNLTVNEVKEGYWYLNSPHGVKEIHHHKPIEGAIKRMDVIYQGALTDLIYNNGHGSVYIMKGNTPLSVLPCTWIKSIPQTDSTSPGTLALGQPEKFK